MGLDVGSKTIGVAVSDELGLCAHAVTTLRRQGMRRDVAAVLAIVCLGATARMQLGYWRNSESLFGRMLQIDGGDANLKADRRTILKAELGWKPLAGLTARPASAQAMIRKPRRTLAV